MHFFAGHFTECIRFRLHLSPTPPAAGGVVITRSADRRGVKRKRVYQERETEVYNTFTVCIFILF